MTEVQRIIDLLNRAFEGNAWHGWPLREILSDVTYTMASSRVLGSAHTIWEDVHHVSAWEDIVRRRLGGEDVEPTPEEDWPPVKENTKDAWEKSLKRLYAGHAKLVEAVSRLLDQQLNRKVTGKDYDVYIMLHGAIHHNIYHSGQIAVMKKELMKLQ